MKLQVKDALFINYMGENPMPYAKYNIARILRVPLFVAELRRCKNLVNKSSECKVRFFEL